MTSLPYPESGRSRSQRVWPRTDSRSLEAPLCPCMRNQELDPYPRLAGTSSCRRSLRSTGKTAHSSTSPEHSTDRPLHCGPPSGTLSKSTPQVSPWPYQTHLSQSRLCLTDSPTPDRVHRSLSGQYIHMISLGRAAGRQGIPNGTRISKNTCRPARYSSNRHFGRVLSDCMSDFREMGSPMGLPTSSPPDQK